MILHFFFLNQLYFKSCKSYTETASGSVNRATETITRGLYFMGHLSLHIFFLGSSR